MSCCDLVGELMLPSYVSFLTFHCLCRSAPHIPQVIIPEEPVVKVATEVRVEINRGFAVLRDIASGKDLKKFLSVITI